MSIEDIRATIEAGRERVRNIRQENENARPIDTYSWIVFDPLGAYVTSLDGHYKPLKFTEDGQVVNTIGWSDDQFARIQAVVDAYRAEV